MEQLGHLCKQWINVPRLMIISHVTESENLAVRIQKYPYEKQGYSRMSLIYRLMFCPRKVIPDTFAEARP